jgi:hypothetical protein
VQIEYLRRVEARVGDNPEAPARIVEALAGLSISLAHLREAFVSHVLMRTPLETVRARFVEMAGSKEEEEESVDDGLPISIEDD